ncbi:hypothetical protein M433DRAFT_50390, partial [Acidomyces richmondensis BFW]
VTAIKYIRASGQALPPLIIFRVQYTNSGWILVSTPPNWRFLTSTSRWTLDCHAYKWLKTVFDPKTRRIDRKRRLLILNGYGSYLTARFIAYCLNKAIDLVVLLLHLLYIL